VAVSALDIIGTAFERMRRQLFGPFRMGQWVRLAIVGLLAGEMGSGGGCSTNVPFDIPSSQSDQFQFPGPPGGGPLAVFGIALLLLAGFALAIVLLYVSSRMRFVLFDAIVTGECRIRESWRRHGTPAFRYFVWQLGFLFAAIISFGVLIGIPLLIAFGMGLFQNPSEHIVALVLGGLLVLCILLAWVVVFGSVHVLTKDFVVPQMALDDLTASQGWSRLWPMMKSEKGNYAVYLVMKLLLDLAATIVLGIVILVVVLIILIPVGGVGFLTVLAGQAAGIGWNPVTIATAIVVGSIVLLGLLFVGAMISVPAVVFFPAYSVYFFADRYPRLRALLYPPSPPELSTPSPQL